MADAVAIGGEFVLKLEAVDAERHGVVGMLREIVPKLIGDHVAQPPRGASVPRGPQVDDGDQRFGLRHKGDRARLAVDERHFAEDFAAAQDGKLVTGWEAVNRREAFLRQGDLPIHDDINLAGVPHPFLHDHAAGLELLMFYVRNDELNLLPG